MARYQRLVEAVKQTEEEVKNDGLTRQSAARLWQQMPAQLRRDASLREFLRSLKGYLEKEGSKVPDPLVLDPLFTGTERTFGRD